KHITARFFYSSRRRHTRSKRDWSSDVCSSDLEAMEEAASELGLSRDVAKELIIQTVIGAGEMLRNTGEAASDLREKITSPAGTTEAGIEALNSYNFSEAV